MSRYPTPFDRHPASRSTSTLISTRSTIENPQRGCLLTFIDIPLALSAVDENKKTQHKTYRPN
jgi:hypothetical protein